MLLDSGPVYVIIEMFPFNKPKPTDRDRLEVGDFAYVNPAGLGVWLRM